LQRIPTVDFGAILTSTEPAWRARLDELFARMNFILGEQVAGFEAEFAAAMGARHSVTVGTGTAAIELALRDAGIQRPDQEVVVPALTAFFTGVGVCSTGASIRFADVDPDTLLMDPADVANRATRKTAAIVPVHLYGQPCDLDGIGKVAAKRGAVVVQDACQAHGARYRDRPLTDFSRYVAYSFYPTKNLGALGDGGAIATSSSQAATRLRRMRDGGRKGDQVAHGWGINSRLDEMHACYLRAFLTRLPEWNATRAKLAGVYAEALRGIEGVEPVRTSNSVWHLYVVRAARRDKLRAHLAAKGIGSGIHYPVPLHLMPAFASAGLKRGDLPNAERACREVLSLPLHPFLAESAVCEVADEVRKFYLG
jgi:dTDP-3-amino-3,4,6-trideoxy-alpha-D-glucose transaminase